VTGRPGARAAFQLAVLFAVGLLAGIWTFIAPWVVGFPSRRPGVWSSSTWATVWVAAVVVGVSALGLVIALGLTVSAALRSRPNGPLEADGT
jgi:hypothetical protein